MPKDMLAEEIISSKAKLITLGRPWPPYLGSQDRPVQPPSMKVR